MLRMFYHDDVICICYRIYNVQEEDAGRYICSAQSQSGSSRDYAVLHVSGKC